MLKSNLRKEDKKMERKFWLSILGVVVLSLIFVNPAAAKLEGKSVKLGGLFGVSGVCAEWGMNGKIGTEIAMEEINASGGIGGLPIELVWYDDECRGLRPSSLGETGQTGQSAAVNEPCQSSTVGHVPKLERIIWLILARPSRPFRHGRGWVSEHLDQR
jgi:branched-chain amino acid transport system substrate-binding protein